ncbi:hypothetical protein DL770_010970 [Monosporascus sp. CRB-9-2]|nr:hypothetical protein DL770_010970 [Monosporascus sp. CRB-9-2]
MRASNNGHLEVVKLLLDKGPEVDVKDKYGGQTPLSWAARNGHKEIVQLLLDKGAEIDSKSNGGQMPLLWAAEKGHKEVVHVTAMGLTNY